MKNPQPTTTAGGRCCNDPHNLPHLPVDSNLYDAISAIECHLGGAPDHLPEPGRVVRFETDRRGRRDGWAVVMPDGDAVVFGDHKTGEKFTWQSKTGSDWRPRALRPAPIVTADLVATERLKRDLRQLTTDDGTVVAYLTGRGLSGAGGADLHLLPGCYHAESGERYPAMCGLFRDLSGKVAGIHRTYLDPATGSKAPVYPVKKLSAAIYPGAYRGTAIQLFPADGPCLAIAEGIETSLAVRELSGLPVWAAGCAAMLAAVRVPDHVTDVEIWSDNDRNGTGQNTGRQAAQRLAAEGRRVTIRIVPEPGTDWLDFLVAGGADHE